jgi:hypothetical protein
VIYQDWHNSMARTIILKYQVKAEKPIFSNDSLERYELRELKHVCDPNKSDRENLDDAFCKACELGANPNKQVRWGFI